MSEPEAEQKDRGGVVYDAPNQQVVRPDGSAPWEEGEGGSTGNAPQLQAQQQQAENGEDLDSMTKTELLDYARNIGVSPANNDMTKDELRAGIDAKLGEG